MCSQFKKQNLFYWYITGQPIGTHPGNNIIEIIEQYYTNSVANLKNNSAHANFVVRRVRAVSTARQTTVLGPEVNKY